MATQITNRSPLTQALKSCYPALGATFVLSMFINATMLASPLYSMQVYDRVLTSRNVSTTEPAKLLVFYVKNKDAPPTVLVPHDHK